MSDKKTLSFDNTSIRMNSEEKGGGLLGDQNNKFVFQLQKPPGAHSEEYGTHKATRHFWSQIWKNFLHLV